MSLPPRVEPTDKYAATPPAPRPRGFAAISPEAQREIARKGGKALYRSKGSAHMSRMGQQGGRESAMARNVRRQPHEHKTEPIPKPMPNLR